MPGTKKSLQRRKALSRENAARQQEDGRQPWKFKGCSKQKPAPKPNHRALHAEARKEAQERQQEVQQLHEELHLQQQNFSQQMERLHEALKEHCAQAQSKLGNDQLELHAAEMKDLRMQHNQEVQQLEKQQQQRLREVLHAQDQRQLEQQHEHTLEMQQQLARHAQQLEHLREAHARMEAQLREELTAQMSLLQQELSAVRSTVCTEPAMQFSLEEVNAEGFHVEIPRGRDACVRDALGRILVLYKANGNARRLSHEQQSEELRIMKELVCAVCAKARKTDGSAARAGASSSMGSGIDMGQNSVAPAHAVCARRRVPGTLHPYEMATLGMRAPQGSTGANATYGWHGPKTW